MLQSIVLALKYIALNFALKYDFIYLLHTYNRDKENTVRMKVTSQSLLKFWKLRGSTLPMSDPLFTTV